MTTEEYRNLIGFVRTQAQSIAQAITNAPDPESEMALEHFLGCARAANRMVDRMEFLLTISDSGETPEKVKESRHMGHIRLLEPMPFTYSNFPERNYTLDPGDYAAYLCCVRDFNMIQTVSGERRALKGFRYEILSDTV